MEDLKTSKTIIEAADLPLEDKVYLKKGIFGWRIVHPYKNPDGTFNYANLFFGGWSNLILTLLLVALVLIGIYAHYHDLDAIRNSCLIFKTAIVPGKAQILP